MPARVERVAAMVRAQAGHDLVVLPELWAHGGFSYREWDERAEPTTGPTAQAMAAAARDAGVMLHAGSIVERPGRRRDRPGGAWAVEHVAGLLRAGELVATYRKIHRFGFGAGEPRLMDAGQTSCSSTCRTARAGPGSPPATTCASPSCTACSSTPARPASSSPPRGRWRGCGTGPCWPTRGRSRTSAPSSPATPRAPTRGTEMGGHSQVVMPTGDALAMAGTEEQVLSVDIDLERGDGVPQRVFPVLGRPPPVAAALAPRLARVGVVRAGSAGLLRVELADGEPRALWVLDQCGPGPGGVLTCEHHPAQPLDAAAVSSRSATVNDTCQCGASPAPTAASQPMASSKPGGARNSACRSRMPGSSRGLQVVAVPGATDHHREAESSKAQPKAAA